MTFAMQKVRVPVQFCTSLLKVRVPVQFCTTLLVIAVNEQRIQNVDNKTFGT
jgi:hypothetical protein